MAMQEITTFPSKKVYFLLKFLTRTVTIGNTNVNFQLLSHVKKVENVTVVHCEPS